MNENNNDDLKQQQQLKGKFRADLVTLNDGAFFVAVYPFSEAMNKWLVTKSLDFNIQWRPYMSMMPLGLYQRLCPQMTKEGFQRVLES